MLAERGTACATRSVQLCRAAPRSGEPGSPWLALRLSKGAPATQQTRGPGRGRERGVSGRGRCEGAPSGGAPAHACPERRVPGLLRVGAAPPWPQGPRDGGAAPPSPGPWDTGRQPCPSISARSVYREDRGPVQLPVREGTAPHHQRGQGRRALAASGGRERQGAVGEAAPPAGLAGHPPQQGGARAPPTGREGPWLARPRGGAGWPVTSDTRARSCRLAPRRAEYRSGPSSPKSPGSRGCGTFAGQRAASASCTTTSRRRSRRGRREVRGPPHARPGASQGRMFSEAQSRTVRPPLGRGRQPR